MRTRHRRHKSLIVATILAAQIGCSQSAQNSSPPNSENELSSVSQVAPTAPAPHPEEPSTPVESFDSHRFLLLSRRPVLVEVRTSVDGQAPSENLQPVIDYVLAAADTNADQRSTWIELMSNNSFIGGRLVMQATGVDAVADTLQTDSWPSQYDVNSNQIVDPSEVIPFVTDYQFNQIVSFTSGLSYGDDSQFESAILKIIDANRNEQFDDDELENLPSTLMRHDFNDDECIELAEVAVLEAAPEMVESMAMVNSTNNNVAGTMLYPDRAWIRNHFLLKKRFGVAGRITPEALGKELFASLNQNEDSQIDESELPGLWTAKPNITIRLRLNPDHNFLSSNDPTFEDASESTGQFRLDELTLLCSITDEAQPSLPPPKSDAPGGERAQSQLLSRARKCLAANRVQFLINEQQDAVFSLIDRNNDGRLSSRELRSAEAAIRNCDKNADGKTFVEEVVPTIHLQIVRGGEVSELMPEQSRNFVSPKTDAPDWFVATDRNNDGELSPREFLGRAAQFAALDSNKDGALTPSEVTRALSRKFPPKLE